MQRVYLIIFVVILALLISNGDCWFSRRRRRQQPSGGSSSTSYSDVYKTGGRSSQSSGGVTGYYKTGTGLKSVQQGGLPGPKIDFDYKLPDVKNKGRWSLSNGGVTYKFPNGHSVTGYRSDKNGGTIGIQFKFATGRKRRSVEDEKLGGIETYDSGMPIPFNPKPLFFKNEKQTENDKMDASDDLSSPDNGMIQERDDCRQCLEIQPFNASDQNVENTTLASNDFVMVVKLIEENLSALKLDARIKFEVIEIVKSPTDNVTSGQIFTIKAEMATCPCLATLGPGFYVVTGQTNDENQLVLSKVLMEFEN